jgi:hypothetical protein
MKKGLCKKKLSGGNTKKSSFSKRFFVSWERREAFNFQDFWVSFWPICVLDSFPILFGKAFTKEEEGKKGFLIVKTKDSPFSSRIQLFASFL